MLIKSGEGEAFQSYYRKGARSAGKGGHMMCIHSLSLGPYLSPSLTNVYDSMCLSSCAHAHTRAHSHTHTRTYSPRTDRCTLEEVFVAVLCFRKLLFTREIITVKRTLEEAFVAVDVANDLDGWVV
jgi:hypothetical protein